ncbi:MCP four helix bundle domain-containing protein [Bradyrhizobium betae]
MRERIEKTRKVYERLINVPEERSLYEQWSKAWAEYLNGVQETMALSRKSVGKFPVDANEMLQTKVAKMAQAADPLLQKGIELNNSGAELETKQAADSYALIFRVLVGIIIAAGPDRDRRRLLSRARRFSRHRLDHPPDAVARRG